MHRHTLTIDTVCMLRSVQNYDDSLLFRSISSVIVIPSIVNHKNRRNGGIETISIRSSIDDWAMRTWLNADDKQILKVAVNCQHIYYNVPHTVIIWAQICTSYSKINSTGPDEAVFEYG